MSDDEKAEPDTAKPEEGETDEAAPEAAKREAPAKKRKKKKRKHAAFDAADQGPARPAGWPSFARKSIRWTVTPLKCSAPAFSATDC